ncbi:MAG: hypothetical protein MJ197_09605 [Bacteroidales bacterium]|nr:hypothetical protein [Bacteroidales bacterium]
MNIIQKSFVLSLILFVIASCLFTSCGKDAYMEDVDTTRGVWGQILLYDETGAVEKDHSDISIKIHCIDTLSETSIWDTVYYMKTDAKGYWDLYKPHGGWYFVEFTKDGYGKNALYAYRYDTTSADTLETMFLAKPSQGAIELDSLSVKENVLSIYRTLYFTANWSSYSLSTWYFFGKTPDVSAENYDYSYNSGSASSAGGKERHTVVLKPLEKLLENGFVEGDKVYVRAYCDNARAVSYQTETDVFVYPNLLESSSVLSFEIPESEE